MSKAQQLRDRLKQRLTAADEEIFELLEGLIADYEEEIHHLKEENKGRKVLEALFNPQVCVYKTDMQPLLVIKEEESLPEHQKQNLSVDQEDMKEEEEKLWTSQQGEQLQQLEESDLTKFGLTVVSVKSEDEDEEPESSQLHQSQSDDITEAEPVASSSSGHRTLTGEDDGGPQAARNSGPYSHLQPGTSDRNSDSSGSETDDSDDWKRATELQSRFNCQENTNIVSSIDCYFAETQFIYSKSSGPMNNFEHYKGRQASVNPLSCSDWIKRENQEEALNQCSTIQTEKTQFSCAECGQRFTRKGDLKNHMIIHIGQKQFACSECDQRFVFKSYLEKHMIIHTEQKQFACSECGRRFGDKNGLKRHMIVHTGQKQFGCPLCGRRFGLKGNLKTHMIIHTELKQFGCCECGRRFRHKSNLTRHMRIHRGPKGQANRDNQQVQSNLLPYNLIEMANNFHPGGYLYN